MRLKNAEMLLLEAHCSLIKPFTNDDDKALIVVHGTT